MRRHILVALMVFLYTPALAFIHVPNWDATYESEPADLDSVGDGAGEMRTMKGGISERAAVQHQFGSPVDTGFHKEGSAWALTSADCSAEVIDPNHEDGRICVGTGDLSMWVIESGSWKRVTGIPQDALILWDQSSTCPIGFSEATEFRNLTVRGADSGGTEANIPDTPGETCEGDGSGNPNCPNQAGRYDDQITEVQMPSHNHDGAPPGAPWTAYATGGVLVFNYQTGAFTFSHRTFYPEGGDEDHYHPFRTVIFCRKD